VKLAFLLSLLITAPILRSPKDAANQPSKLISKKLTLPSRGPLPNPAHVLSWRWLPGFTATSFWYKVESSINLITWEAWTNTTATNIQIETPDPFRAFRVSSTNTTPAFVGGTITLAWDAVTNAAGYNLYFGPATRTYTNTSNAGSNLQYTVTAPINVKSFFSVTAYDSFGVESDYSSEISNQPFPIIKIE
jgi:hypothetical protein